jgi:hypothetical protein
MQQRARREVSVTLAIVIDFAHTSEQPLRDRPSRDGTLVYRAAVELLDR